MKRRLLVAFLALSLCMPAQAAGPLAILLLGYVKNAIRERVVSAVKDAVLERVPGGAMIGQMMSARGNPMAMMSAMSGGLRGGMGGGGGMPSMERIAAMGGSPEAMAQIQAMMAGDQTPLSPQEWEELAAILGRNGADPDAAGSVAQMRESAAQMPMMNATLRNMLVQMRGVAQARDEAYATYEKMSEAERAEMVEAFVAEYRGMDAQDQADYAEALRSGSMPLPGDLGQRLLAALPPA